MIREKKYFFVLGVDIGGTKTAVSLGSSDGRLYAHNRIRMDERDPDDIIQEIVKSCLDLVKESNISWSEVKAIGICSPAPLDVKHGVILKPVNLPKWDNIRICDELQEKLGIRAYMENDANAGALAEWFFGAGHGCDDLVYLTMSTGIGGGIISGGKLLVGASFMAGEIGHMVLDVNGPPCLCGLNGCYEAFAGGLAVTRRMKAELAGHRNSHIVKLAQGIENVNLHILEQAVRDGDDYAISIWQGMCYRHAQAAGIIINVLSPAKIILGTIAHATGRLFMDEFGRHLDKFCLPQLRSHCEVTVSKLGRQIAEYSGIAVALDIMREKGLWKIPNIK
jgi:glucokinase